MNQNTDEYWMCRAYLQAKQARDRGEVPVGCVIVSSKQKMISAACNRPIGLCDPTAHAEIIALRKAAIILKNYRLNDTTVYVTLEPCMMCAYAMIHARISRLVYGAKDPKTGAAGSTIDVFNMPSNHKVVVKGGVLEDLCSELLSNFFIRRRQQRD